MRANQDWLHSTTYYQVLRSHVTQISSHESQYSLVSHELINPLGPTPYELLDSRSSPPLATPTVCLIWSPWVHEADSCYGSMARLWRLRR